MNGFLTADAMGGPFFIIVPIIFLLLVGIAVLIIVLITKAILKRMKKKDRGNDPEEGEGYENF